MKLLARSSKWASVGSLISLLIVPVAHGQSQSTNYAIKSSALVSTGGKSGSTSFALWNAMGQSGALGKATSTGYAAGIGLLRTLGVSAPAITLLPVAIPQQTTAAPIRALITDPQSLPLTATLYYRLGGASSYIPDSMSKSAVGDTFTATIPAVSVTMRGLEYYISATNGFSVTTFPATDPVNRPWHLRVAITNQASPSALGAGAYWMIGFPFEVSPTGITDQLGDDFGTYDNTVWRLFRWNGGATPPAYVEHPSTPSFGSGRAFWLVSRDAKNYDGTGTSTLEDTVSTGVTFDYYKIPLDSGWNQITDPFFYPVRLDSCEVLKSGVVVPRVTRNLLIEDSLWEYAGGTSYTITPRFTAWTGVWLRSWSRGLTLLVPARDQANNPPAPPVRSPIVWQVSISAQSSQAQDNTARFGIAQGASPTWDRLDLSKPPAVVPSVLVFFPKDNTNGRPGEFATDFRPEIGDGQSWSFTVASDGSERPVRVTFEDITAVPSQWSVGLIDLLSGVRQDLRRNQSYSFTPEKGVSQRGFEIRVGSAEFVDKPTGTGVPYLFSLGQNHPNPFNPLTTIAYTLPANGAINLSVYNILGQRVRTLVEGDQTAGVHRVVWDGTDGNGEQVASGIYFYRLVAGNQTQTRKMMLLR